MRAMTDFDDVRGLSLADKMIVDKLRHEIVELLDEASSQHLRTFKKFGFVVELWRRGIEIGRPNTGYLPYTVHVIGWWPPMYEAREMGRYTSARMGGMLDNRLSGLTDND